MIDPETQQRIRREVEEETFRASLRSKRPLGPRVWALANSAVVLWFLSAVVVTSLTSFIAKRERLAVRATEQDARHQRLLYEFGQRWKRFGQATRGADFLTQFNERLPQVRTFLFGAPRASSLGYVFPEFADHTLTSIMIELEISTIEDDLAAKIRQLRSQLEHLGVALSYARDTADPTSSLSEYRIDWYEVLSALGYQGDLEELDVRGELVPRRDFPAK
jgi:hypothetical protein